ncbi:unnamed protein product [Hyaloperonospora brassicae]|uniref:Uncharacterized protein n=1 Tax=Hyaloperonospora brassicae TaxID=162125 RepID=A0AAV0U1R6_HYABA|nr:unnamed protein product [Hyaloperonospora brassicae]
METWTATRRHLLSFKDDHVPCTRVTVKDDATFCVQGDACGNPLANVYPKGAPGACPRRNDKPISGCTATSARFGDDCVAPVDAHCVLQEGGAWQCVFQADGRAWNGTEQDEMAPYGQVKMPSSSPMSDQSVKLSASNQEQHGMSKTMGASNASINIAVGVACCVLAFVGLVFVKKRRNRERSNSYTLSEKDISIVTL